MMDDRLTDQTPLASPSHEPLMTISVFAEASRLSTKALRLYDDLGLLPPCRTDEANGYRYYAPSQLPDARLIALLRQLGLSLAAIREVLAADEDARPETLRHEWAQKRAEHLRQEKLFGYVQHTLQGTSPLSHLQPQLRHVPAQRVATLSRPALARELPAVIDELRRELEHYLKEQGGEANGAPFVIYHGEVNTDSDGPIEVCQPYAGTLQPSGAVTLREEAAHAEAFIRLTRDEFRFPDILAAYDLLAQYAQERGTGSSLRCREIYLGEWDDLTGDDVAGEVAWPFVPDTVARFAAHTIYSDPKASAPALAAVAESPRLLTEQVRGLISHYRVTPDLPSGREFDRQARWVEAALSLLQARSAAPLSQSRPPSERFVGCCRDYALLTVAALRQRGVPARIRIGWAPYFNPDFVHDHVVAEWHDGERWVRGDPELVPDDYPFDTLNLPEGTFQTAAEAWLAYRAGQLDASRYGVAPELYGGPDMLRDYVLRELAALTGHELLLWDNWGLMQVPFSKLTAEQLDLLDAVAHALRSEDVAAWLRWAQHPAFQVPAVIDTFDFAGGFQETRLR